MEGKMKAIKYLMFFFNLLFWLSGLTLIIIGAIIRDKDGDYLTFAASKYANAAVFLIVVGVIICIIGFLGCCGALKENYCMIATFALLLTIIFILEIAAGSLGYAYRGKVKVIVEKSLHRGMDNYSKEKGTKMFIDWLQKKFKCCGYNSATDWANRTISAPLAAKPVIHKVGNGTVSPNTKVPSSCKIDNGNVYTVGCKVKFEHFIQKNLKLIGGFGIGFAFLQILGIAFACCIMREIRNKYQAV